MKKTPESLEPVLHCANAEATEKTWRGIVMGPHLEVLGLPAPPEGGPAMGVGSLQAFEEVRARLREFLKRLVELEGPYSVDAGGLAAELFDRAKPKLERWAFSTRDERLFEIWDTVDQSFEQMVYYYLALALKEISFRDVHCCEECESFFFKASDRERKYCSNKCRSRVMARQHRQRLAEKKPTARKARKATGGKKSSRK